MRSMFQYILFCFSLVVYSSIFAQKNYPEVQVIATGTKTNIRGLSVVTDNVIWVCGSHGTVGKSTNGGKTGNGKQLRGLKKLISVISKPLMQQEQS